MRTTRIQPGGLTPHPAYRLIANALIHAI